MANNVFANGREISCKKADGKSICAFPDVCFTPPENPATPPGVPIPYPNTGMAKDTTSGSKKVKISGNEVMLKNKSYFKKSVGDEAGCAAKKGIITSTNRGKVYFTMWSMDVKVEGQNVVRHLDMTTHNHMCSPGNGPLWAHIDSMAKGMDGKCKEQLDEAAEACKEPDGSLEVTVKTAEGNDQKQRICEDKCEEAMKCVMVPKSKDKKLCCAPANTGHHVVPASQFQDGSGGDISGSKYSYGKAPCVCVEGHSHSAGGEHEDIHTETNCATIEHIGTTAGKIIPKTKRWKLKEAETVGAKSVSKVMGCDDDCVEKQIRKEHQGMGLGPETDVRPSTAGKLTRPSAPPTPGFGD